MFDFANFPLWLNVFLFAIAGAAVVLAGVRMTAAADRLADMTGLGEAVTGAVLLGASTSLPGIVASVTAAAAGHPQLAISNAIGGIAAQTLFIAIADFAHRRANLEHAAASATNLVSAVVLISLLSLPMLAATAPSFTVWSINPCTFVLLGAYVYSLRLAQKIERTPMWDPQKTPETELDEPDEPPADRRAIVRMGLGFAALALIVGFAGFVIAKSGIAIAEQANISEGVVGTLFTGVVTSLPELVTTISAVRRGALTLAVGGILGGNTFDVLFVAFADVAYREGSIYHAMTDQQSFVFLVAILMTAVLTLGLLRREKHGVANVGFESMSIIVIYGVGMILLAAGQ